MDKCIFVFLLVLGMAIPSEASEEHSCVDVFISISEANFSVVDRMIKLMGEATVFSNEHFISTDNRENMDFEISSDDNNFKMLLKPRLLSQSTLVYRITVGEVTINDSMDYNFPNVTMKEEFEELMRSYYTDPNPTLDDETSDSLSNIVDHIRARLEYLKAHPEQLRSRIIVN